MKARDLISIRDFDNADIEGLFGVADRMERLLHSSHGQLAGHILGSLFLEPSTRTRLSFESAMNRLGGRVLTLSDAGASSFSKGESLADSVRMVSSYADVLVLRHPSAGAARLAARISPVPVINAGDGGHEHPTQTLCDLFALRRRKGRLDGLKVILYGDLKYGRTTHSLSMALTRFGSDVLCVNEPGLALPSYVARDCEDVGGARGRETKITGMTDVFGPAGTKGLLFSHDPESWGFDGQGIDLSRLELDAIYVTRLQRERLADSERGRAATLPNVDRAFLAAQPFSTAVVLHPLPRVDEIHPDVDRDPRSAYFQQAAWGVPIRMALLSCLLGQETFVIPAMDPSVAVVDGGTAHCEDPGCITQSERSEAEPEWRSDGAGQLRCAYCDSPQASEKSEM